MQPAFQSRTRGPAQLVGFGGFLRLLVALAIVGAVGRPLAASGREARQDRRLGARAKHAALRDFDGTGQRFRQIREQRCHLGAGLEPVLRRELPALAVGDQFALGDAKQRIVGFIILARSKERFVGGDERQSVRIGEIDQLRLSKAFARHAMALQFDVEAVAE